MHERVRYDLTATDADVPTQPVSIVVAATFTAEPIRPVLTYLLQLAGLTPSLSFAPYYQVVQQLLVPTSALRQNNGGVNILLLCLDTAGQDSDLASLDQLIGAFQKGASGVGAAWIVASCPPMPEVFRSSILKSNWRTAERRLVRGLEHIPGLVSLRAADILRAHHIRRYYDGYAAHLGDVRYTDVFFAALAATLARKVHAQVACPRKVIVLDCDNTLWSGSCSEDGPSGLVMDGPWQYLQRFVVNQKEAGVLLCLCSRNEENEVWRVFEERRDMILSRHDLVGWRINWASKIENMCSLANELGLSLETFIFIDDDPLQCAEVRSRLPQVLTIQLPNDPSRIPSFLDAVWAFDRVGLTDEDRARTTQYQSNCERTRACKRAATLDDVVKMLDVRVDIRKTEEGQLVRVAQLSQRASQFNCTLTKRSTAEMRQVLGDHGYFMFSVHASDRYGDYGLIGVLIVHIVMSTLNIDTFLLSCRVLGRNIEHEMLRKVETFAREWGLLEMRVPFTQGPRNSIAKDFLDKLESPWIRQWIGETLNYVLIL